MSDKNVVFVFLFQQRYDPNNRSVQNPMVSLDDVAQAITALNLQGKTNLSAKNPANFMKDYLRSNKRNENWPDAIKNAGFTARQRTGDEQCFEFVPLPAGEDPFPDDYVAKGSEETFTIQTLSLPVGTREIVRADEQSLAQLAVKLQMVEHFMASSPSSTEWKLIEVTHLQNNVKLRATEIDALYQAVIEVDGELVVGAIAVEVKIKDPFIAEQIAQQIQAVLADDSFSFCIPALVKQTSQGTILVMHLDKMHGDVLNAGQGVQPGEAKHSAIYKFVPPLKKL